MKLFDKLNGYENKEDHLLLHFDDGDMRLYFMSPRIARVVTSFDEEYRELSYNLVTTAWEDGADRYFGEKRTRIRPCMIRVTEREEELICRPGITPRAEDDGLADDAEEKAPLTIKIQRSPFGIAVLDEDGEVAFSDVYGKAYRKDGNLRRWHMARIFEKDAFFGFGEKTGPMNKYGDRVKMAPSDAMGYDPMRTDPLYKHIPFFIRLNAVSKKAFGCFYHNMSPSEFDMGRGKCNYYPEHYTYCADDGKLDLFLLAGPKVTDVIEEYTFLTGRSAMLPKYALGYLGSSMYYSELEQDSDEAILSFVKKARDMGMPMSGFQLSSGYTTQENNKRCVFTWNHDRFRDPKDFVKKMKRAGVHISANVKPGFLLVHPKVEELKEKGFFIRNEAGDDYEIGSWWGGDGYFADLTDPKNRQIWSELLKENLLDYGIDSVWDDNCEVDSIINDDAKVDAEGMGGRVASYRPAIANIMCKLATEGLLAADKDRRPYVVCRAGAAGIQSFAQTWAGDNLTCWESLQYNIGTVLGMGLSGVANQGCDIGGFHGPVPEPELLVRWVQNGIFMPRFSIHSCNTDNTVTEPWMYPSVAGEIREAIRLRYRLLPYMYSLMEEASEKGLPILRPLFMKYQEDENCYEECVEFLLGEALLVANVVIKSAEAIEVYFPKGGRFYDIKTGICYEGGAPVLIPVTLQDVPMFLCEGGILPVAENVPIIEDDGKSIGFFTEGDASREGRRFEPKTLRLLLFPGKDTSFTYYEDDGETMNYRNGDYKKSRITMTGDEKTSVVLTVEREGSYVSSTAGVVLEMVCDEVCPLCVSLDGEIIRYFTDGNDFEKARDDKNSAWYYDAEKHKAKIYYPRPKADYKVEISFLRHDLIGM
ncbi:MAG: DUF5110 domain-containing protein [Lachnospiraceae bacterium]|nr:DUF5110 domain-containing protein [Lachnospiraceae bacterium]